MKDKDKYFKEVKKIFPISGKREKNFLKGIQSQINELGDCTYEEIIEEMGEPKDVVASYYEEIDGQYLIKKMNTRRLVKWLGIVVTIIVLITCLVFAYEVHKERKAFEEQLPLQFEEVIE